MPDEHYTPGTGRRSEGTPARGRAGRRRSMDTYGGISVSDVVARHTGERPTFAPGTLPQEDAPAHRTEPAEPEPEPRRRRAAPPRPSATQTPPAPRVPRPDQPPTPPDGPRPPRPPRPRRPTAAAPVPGAPPERRPPANGATPQQAPPQPRRARRPAPPGAGGPPVPPPAAAQTAVVPAANGKKPAASGPAPAAAPPGANGKAPEARPRRPRPAPAEQPTRVTNGVKPAAAAAAATAAVPPRASLDPLTMTDEMEVIDEATQYRRKIDHTLARFSAAHDELEAEEAKRRERRDRLTARPTALLEQTRTALMRVVAPSSSAAAEPEAKPNPQEKAPQTRLQEKKQRHNERTLKAGRIAAIIVALLVFLATGIAWGAKTWFDAKFNTITALDENSADIQDAAGQTGDENFLLVGSDTRDGASAEENVGDKNAIPGARSDTVMIAHIPADRKRVVVVSFPRDLEVSQPECARWDPATSKYSEEKSPAVKITKLNTAYGAGGPQCVTRVIQQITGMRINHFVGIDFNGFKAMVDAVHGVNVHVEKPIDDTTLGMVISQTGDVQISGDQALSYVRARHVKGDPTSDYGRMKRQQTFIASLLKKVMSSDVLLNAGKLSGFIDAFAKATFGENLGIDQMMTLAKSMRGVDLSKITFMTVPTTGNANARGNEVLMQTQTKSLFQALIDNTPLPDPNAPAPDTGKDTGTSGTSGTTGKPGTKRTSNSG
ncbi:LCP family protein [Amycolatopsis samaneae]|uniref:LCP family protein n=1 Tax=Amycolatopsis samaneae TaxID=664691 RepID=UPI0036227341